MSLLSLPLALILMSGYFMTPPEDVSVSSLLTSGVWGRILQGGSASFVAAMENLTFLVLFLLLFANYLSEHFRCGAVYVFTRIRSRRRWCMSRITEMTVYAAIYVSLYLIVSCAACCCRSTRPLTAADGRTIAMIFAFAMLLVMLFTVLANMVALRWGTAMGIFLPLLAMCLLLFLAIRTSDIGWCQVINPLSCLDFAAREPVGQLLALGSNALLAGAAIAAITVMVARFDVAMYDPELR